MELTEKVAGEEPECDGGDCANVFKTDQPETIAVQGYLTDLPAPDGEAVVTLPEAVLKEAARALGW
ncbi:hypothetical protein ACFVW2_02580 [Streptomyces sp. NPDC058171]